MEIPLDAEIAAPSLPSQDERILAALAHAGIILPLMGILAPIFIWVTQKDKSRFVAFQSLQALAYHLLLFLGYILGIACYFFSFFLTFGGLFFASSSQDPVNGLFGLFSLAPFAAMGIFFCAGFLYVIYGLVGAALALSGKDFRYLLLGDFLERKMEQV
jgi:uncharacterized Tic20 family protein